MLHLTPCTPKQNLLLIQVVFLKEEKKKAKSPHFLLFVMEK